MGTIINETLVVTSWDETRMSTIHDQAVELFTNTDPDYGRVGCLVSDLIGSIRNGYDSFFVAPTGSKLGWGIHEDHSKKLDQLCDLIDRAGGCEYVRVVYGETEPEITKSR